MNAEDKVQVTITGKILDLSYARKLAQIPDLDLYTIVSIWVNSIQVDM